MKNLPESAPLPTTLAEFSEAQLENLRFVSSERFKLNDPTILIVEDQPLARCILEGVMRRQGYLYDSAINGARAIELYAENAPCITFLDVELPDINGHKLAALFKKHDPEGYIVMVTANNYLKDVETAKANKVQGFIVKPYNQKKIMEAIYVFMNQKHKR
jgi:CheY-like chemotaxis protein